MEIVLLLLCVYALWPMYVFCMAMMRAYQENSVTLFAWCLAFPFIVSAIVLDITLNFTVFAILTWDFPKIELTQFSIKVWKWEFEVAAPVSSELTFSQRLNRLVKDDGWRGAVSRWLAANLLDPYDPSGKHIK